MTLRVAQSLQLHVIQKVPRAMAFLDHRARPDQLIVRVELDMVFLVIDVQAIVEDVIGRCAIPIERALAAIWYPVRDETSVRLDSARYHELAIIRQIVGGCVTTLTRDNVSLHGIDEI